MCVVCIYCISKLKVFLSYCIKDYIKFFLKRSVINLIVFNIINF